MGLFDYIYNIMLNDLLGYDIGTSPDYMLEPFALFLTYLTIALLIYFVFYFVKWTIRNISSMFPW